MQPKKLISFIFIYLFAHSAFAQRGFLRTLNHYDSYSEGKKARLKRYYVGYGLPFMGMDVTTHYMADGDASATPSVAPIDLSKQTHVSLSNGFGAEAGTFYILMRNGRQSALCFDIAFSEYFYNYKIGPLTYGSATFSDESSVGIAGMPIGISYKSGGEVTLNKHDKSTLSIGAGIEPTMSISKVIAAETRYGARCYVAAEVGVFAGIEWKLRATYYTGTTTVVNLTADGLDNVSSYNVIGPLGTMDVKAVTGGDFNLSLVLLPFSFKWDR